MFRLDCFGHKMVNSVRPFDMRRHSLSILGVTMIVMFFLFLLLDWIHNLGIDSFQTSLKMAPGNGTLRRSARMLNLSSLDGGGFSLPETPPHTGGAPEAQSTPLASPAVIRAEIGRWKGRQEALVRDLLEASLEKVCWHWLFTTKILILYFKSEVDKKPIIFRQN